MLDTGDVIIHPPNSISLRYHYVARRVVMHIVALGK